MNDWLLLEKKIVASLSERLRQARSAVEKETAAHKEAVKKAANTKEALEILQALAQTIQQNAHRKISDVVSTCLSSVFEDPYQFHIVFERKRGKTEAQLRFTRRELDVDPLTSSGGGVVDVAAFALRVSCLMLSRPRLSRVIVADEPFRFVSAQYQDSVRSMLEQLSKDLKIQIIMVTHNESYETGNVITL